MSKLDRKDEEHWFIAIHNVYMVVPGKPLAHLVIGRASFALLHPEMPGLPKPLQGGESCKMRKGR